jgi:hypothetical protein
MTFLSCNNIKREIPIVHLEQTMKIDELSDSTYFRRISTMLYDDSYIYMSDEYNGRILQLDRNLKLLSTIGRRGQGPQDFAGLGCIILWEDTLLCLNIGGSTLSAFKTDGHFIDNYQISDRSLTDGNFCIDNEGFLYFTSYLDSFPVIKYDRNMNRQFGFGEWNEPENIQYRFIKNNYLITCFDNKILTLQTDDPIINMYDTNGKHLLKTKLPDQLFKRRLAFKKSEQERDPSSAKKIYTLFSDIKSVNSRLYLLYIDHDKDNMPYKNKIVELLFNDNDFIISKVYSLSKNDDAWYSSFTISKDSLIIASNSSMKINPYIGVYQIK